MPTDFAQIVLHCAPADPNQGFVREVVEHWGLMAQWAETLDETVLNGCDVLVLFGPGTVTESMNSAVGGWVERGGQLLCVGSTWELQNVLGLLPFEHMAIGRSHLQPLSGAALFWPEEVGEIAIAGGVLAATTASEMLAQCGPDFCGFSHRVLGRGAAYFVAGDLGRTVSLYQQGVGVATAGVGPNDGTVKFGQGPLRAEDGIALDFNRDRSHAEHNQAPYFGTPHTDAFKELVLKWILRATAECGKSAAIAWYWPDNAEGIAMINVECDDFDPDHVFRMKQIMDVSAVPSNWLVPSPGYPLETYRMIRRWDDEVGLLYVPGEHWSDAAMRSQYLLIGRSSGTPALLTACIRDGGWEGYNEFYAMSDGAGARLSVAKGGRQPGSAGFAFGTCHPFYPRKRDGSAYLTLELPVTVYDPGHTTPTSTMHAIFRQTAMRHGCANVTMQVRMYQNVHGPISMKQVFLLAKQYRLQWTLPNTLILFQRARRHLQWTVDTRGSITLQSDLALNSLTLMVTGHETQWTANQIRPRNVRVTRYGIDFTTVTVDLGARSPLTLAPARELDDLAA